MRTRRESFHLIKWLLKKTQYCRVLSVEVFSKNILKIKIKKKNIQGFLGFPGFFDSTW